MTERVTAMKLRERFEEFGGPNNWRRIDAIHPLDIFIGIDADGHKALELHAKFTPQKVKSSQYISVSQNKLPAYSFIRFSLMTDEETALFCKFCEDLYDESLHAKDPSDGYKLIVNRFWQWRRVFGAPPRKVLNELSQMGLIGEILFMTDVLSKRLGLTRALLSWTGQELTHKDFSYDDTWAEVKAIHKAKGSVLISSLEQLASPNVGELVVYSMEKMSETYNGLTLNKLVYQTRWLFDTDEERDIFDAKVSTQGYSFDPVYDDYVFEVASFTSFRVDDAFPKLTRERMPPAIQKASYELALTEIADWEIRREY